MSTGHVEWTRSMSRTDVMVHNNYWKRITLLALLYLGLSVNRLEQAARAGGNEETVHAHEKLANPCLICGAITISPCTREGFE